MLQMVYRSQVFDFKRISTLQGKDDQAALDSENVHCDKNEPICRSQAVCSILVNRLGRPRWVANKAIRRVR